jgi:hypothetical protein
MPDVAGTGRPEEEAPRRYAVHGDLASLGVKHVNQIAMRAAVPLGGQLQVLRPDVLRLNQQRFSISCHFRPQARRSPEL